jgi:ATP/ADP translocase
MSDHGDPQPSATLVVTFVGAIAVLAIVVLSQALFFGVQRIEDQRKLVAATPDELRNLQALQLERISKYSYLDPNAGLVTIPIDEAISAYVRELKNPPASAPATNAAGPTTTKPSGGITP